MDIKTIKNVNGEAEIAVVYSENVLLFDDNSALDFMMNVRYETGCYNIILNKEAVAEEFFDLKTRLAGGILQKFVNYNFRIAIIGDFSFYENKSRAFKDFVYESNKGRSIFFVGSEKEAVEILSAVIGIKMNSNL